MTPVTLLNLLITLPQIAIYACAVRSTVSLRRPDWYLTLSVLLCGGLYFLFQSVPLPASYAAGLIHIGVSMALPQFFTREKRSVTLICSAAYVVLLVSADIAVLLAWAAFFPQPMEEVLATPHLLLTLKIFYLFLLVVLVFPFRLLLCRLVKPSADTTWGIPLILLPMGQAMLLDILVYAMQEQVDGYWRRMLLLLAVGCSFVVDLIFLASWQRLRRMQTLQAQLQLAEHQLENQLRYYQQLQSGMEKVNHIRHDLNNQLQTAYTLLGSGRTEAAREQLDAIHQQLRERVGTTYCANLVADAVLLEKAELCHRRGIQLEVEAELPQTLPVEGVHLCSVLANLLDNAVEGCEGCSPAWIRLSARLQAGCLTVRCENPVAAGRRERPAKHELLPQRGLGLSILSQLARLYHGELQTQRENGVFTAVLLLPLPVAHGKMEEEQCAAP